jgi:hypothetical protein
MVIVGWVGLAASLGTSLVDQQEHQLKGSFFPLQTSIFVARCQTHRIITGPIFGSSHRSDCVTKFSNQ